MALVRYLHLARSHIAFSLCGLCYLYSGQHLVTQSAQFQVYFYTLLTLSSGSRSAQVEGQTTQMNSWKYETNVLLYSMPSENEILIYCFIQEPSLKKDKYLVHGLVTP